MKKLVLISALALGIIGMNAESVSDYVKVTYEGQEVNDDETIRSEAVNDAKSFYLAEFALNLVDAEQPVTVLLSGFFSTPSLSDWNADQNEWGTPQICTSTTGNCFPGNLEKGYFCGENQPIELSDTNPFLLDFELMGYVDMESQSIVLPPKQGLYGVRILVEVEGDRIADEMVFYVNIGPGAGSGVTDGVETVGVEEDVPAVYYDLTGRKVNTPAPGQVIICKRGAKAYKTIVR